MKRTLLTGSVALLFILSISALSAVQVSASGGRIRLNERAWDHDPLKVYINTSPSLQAYVGYVQTALDDWSSALKDISNNSKAFNFTIVDEKNDADIQIYVYSVAPEDQQLLGLTTYFDHNGDSIFYKVVIEIYVSDISGDEIDFMNIARHEIGHALGLGHEITGEFDLMDPTYSVSRINTLIYPSTLDLKALLYIYYDDGFGLPNNFP